MNIRTGGNFVQNFLLFLLFNRSTRLFTIVLCTLWVCLRVILHDQNVARVDLFLGLSVRAVLRATIIDPDNVETKLRFNNFACLTRLERKGCFLERFYHLSMSKPAKVAPLILAAVIGVFLSKFGEIAASLDLLKDILCLLLCLSGIELRMLRKISVKLSVGCFHLFGQILFGVLACKLLGFLQHNLQLHMPIFVEPLVRCTFLSNIDLSPLLLQISLLLVLDFRLLRSGSFLQNFQEIVELLFFTRLLKVPIDLFRSNIGERSLARVCFLLLFDIGLTNDDCPRKLELIPNLRIRTNALGSGFFG